MNEAQAVDRYDATTIRLHWLTAILVILLWASAQVIDYFPKGTPRITVRSIHIAMGVMLALAIAYRLWWRQQGGRRLPPAGSGLMQFMSRTVHIGLYTLLLVELVLGFGNAWVRGDNIFTLFTIPAFDPGNTPLRLLVEEIHGLVANIILSVAGLHAAAALAHHFVWRDGVMQRMFGKNLARRNSPA